MADEEENLKPTWEGDFVEGLPSGKGGMTYPGLDPESPKDVYEGDMVEGKRQGAESTPSRTEVRTRAATLTTRRAARA